MLCMFSSELAPPWMTELTPQSTELAVCLYWTIFSILR